jgi:hypothetical protein
MCFLESIEVPERQRFLTPMTRRERFRNEQFNSTPSAIPSPCRSRKFDPVGFAL